LPAHGVDVGQGIGGADSAPVKGVVHYRGEEVDRLHQGAPFRQAVDACIVVGANPHQEVWMATGRVVVQRSQNLRQLGGAELAGSTGAV